MQILPYELRPASFSPWRPVYLEVASALIQHLANDWLEVMHIGSTAARVGGKGVIDLSVLYPEGRFRETEIGAKRRVLILAQSAVCS